MATRSQLRKAARADRKLTKARFRNLGRTFTLIAIQAVRDKVWNRTPDDTAICVEAMLFTIVAEFEKWPDNWPHRHFFNGPRGQTCTCGLCEHGVKRSGMNCPDCRATILKLARPIVVPVRQPFSADFPMTFLEMGPPQS